MLTVGSPAPAFQAPDEHGKMHTLQEYSGNWLVLYFYPKDDTPGCTMQACGFRDAWQSYQGKAAVVGVSADSPESHRAFIDKYHLSHTLLADLDRTVINAYGATSDQLGKRVTFLVDPQGIIRKIYRSIDCATHSAVILADLA